MTKMQETNKEYAEALFILAAENNCLEEYSKHLSGIRVLTEENREYIEFLSSPAIPLSERLSAIDEAFGKEMPEYIVSFLKLLCENGRIRELWGSIDEFELLMKNAMNRTVATVYSAVPLSDEQKKALCAKLEKMCSKQIDARYVEDKSLIGGIRVEVDGKTLDGSIEKRLQKVKGVMNA